MIKHIWSILCNNSIINQEDNNLTINSVLEELTASVTVPKGEDVKKPFPLPINYEIVSLWIREDGREEIKPQIEILLRDPEGNELHKAMPESVFPKNFLRLRTRIKVAGLPWTSNGTYIFLVQIKEPGQKLFKAVAELPLQVKLEIKEVMKENKI